MTDLYEQLGVPRDATPQELKKAYRRKAMRAHPDRHGGSEEHFHRLRLAYTVLNDPAKRQKYDRDGTTEEVLSSELQTLAHMLIGLADVIKDGQEEMVDIITALRMKVTEGITNHENMMKQLEGKAKKFRKLASRIKHRGEGDKNMFAIMLENSASRAEENVGKAKEQIEFGRRMMKMLEDYESPIDVAQALINSMTSTILGGLHDEIRRGQSKGG